MSAYLKNNYLNSIPLGETSFVRFLTDIDLISGAMEEQSLIYATPTHFYKILLM